MSSKNKRKLWSWLFKDDEAGDANIEIADSTSDANILKAKEVIQEIESIIQQELALMSEEDIFNFKEENGNVVSLKKKHGPKLIKPLNKKNNRRIVIGDMVYDPIEKVWRGNEQELGKFKTSHRPALITQLSPSTEPIEKNGMVFDPERMIWVGNDSDLDPFEDIESSEGESGFPVGKEFTLPPDLVETFMKCEQTHTEELDGWFAEEFDFRKNLFAIRNMSIIRIINQAKNVRTAEPPVVFHKQHLTPRALFPEEIEPFETEMAKQQHLQAEEEKKSPPKLRRATQSNIQQIPQTNKFHDEEENWDDEFDFGDNTKLSNPLILSPPKPSQNSVQKLFSSSEDEEEREDETEWEGIEVPMGAKLKLRVPASVTEGSQDNLDSICDEDVPSLEPPKAQPVEEDWSDIEFPNDGKLSLKTESSKSEVSRTSGKVSFNNSDDEEWNDVEIPDDFSTRVRQLDPPQAVSQFY